MTRRGKMTYRASSHFAGRNHSNHRLLCCRTADDVGLLSGQTTTFPYHLLALAIVRSFSFFGSLALFRLTDWLLPIRVTAEQEAVGLNEPTRRVHGARVDA